MDIDIKDKGHQMLDSFDDDMAVLIVIGNDYKKTGYCMGGTPADIISVLAGIMSENPQIKGMFEAAWCQCNEADPRELN
jgi:hypothetical protein